MLIILKHIFFQKTRNFVFLFSVVGIGENFTLLLKVNIFFNWLVILGSMT